MVNTARPVHFSDIAELQAFFRKTEGNIPACSRREFVAQLETQIGKYMNNLISLDAEIEDLPIAELQAECASLHHPLSLLEDPEKRRQAHNFLFSIESPEEVKRGLRKYLVDLLGSETLLADDTHHTGLFFFQTLDKVINHIALEYEKVDKEKKRKDGSTHFSHAWGVARLLLETIGYHSKEALFAALLHDYVEDVAGNRREKVKRIRRLLEPVRKFVDVEKVIDIILELTKKELSEHLDPHERLQIFLGLKEEGDLLQGKRRVELKEKRNKKYIKGLKDVKHLATFLIKLADRLHSITHFEGNDLTFVQRKITETYDIIAATQERIAWEKNADIRLLYEHALEIIREQVIRVERTLKQLSGGSYDSKKEKELSPVPISIEKPIYYIEAKSGQHFWNQMRHFRVRVHDLVPHGLLASV